MTMTKKTKLESALIRVRRHTGVPTARAGEGDAQGRVQLVAPAHDGDPNRPAFWALITRDLHPEHARALAAELLEAAKAADGS